MRRLQRQRKKPKCYSPGVIKSYAEIAENNCYTCPERATCLKFVEDFLTETGQFPLQTQIIALAVDAGLVSEDHWGNVYTPYIEDTDIREILIDFSTKLLTTYGHRN